MRRVRAYSIVCSMHRWRPTTLAAHTVMRSSWNCCICERQGFGAALAMNAAPSHTRSRIYNHIHKHHSSSTCALDTGSPSPPPQCGTTVGPEHRRKTPLRSPVTHSGAAHARRRAHVHPPAVSEHSIPSFLIVRATFTPFVFIGRQIRLLFLCGAASDVFASRHILCGGRTYVRQQHNNRSSSSASTKLPTSPPVRHSSSTSCCR